MKYNIIGDIHGRISWEKLVKDDCINIFEGDYFSPYENISFVDQKQNFLNIIDYKNAHPETILLIGNHDEDHWHIQEQYSRFDMINVKRIYDLFEEFKYLFQIAYVTDDNQVLISHAGVSIVWYIKYKYGELAEFYDISKNYRDAKSIDEVVKDLEAHYSLNDQEIYYWNKKYYLYKDESIIDIDVNPKDVANFVNDLWESGKYNAFNFNANCEYYDCYGDSIPQGPLWIRPTALSNVNIFRGTNFIQVVGHSQVEYPQAFNDKKELIDIKNFDIKDNNIVLVDCLGYTNESIIYENKNFIVNKA